jgi:raffinose/stachyose/melibiose transport system substrate-binding protein
VRNRRRQSRTEEEKTMTHLGQARALLAAVAAALFVVAGCGGSENTAGTTGGAAGETAFPTEDVTLTMSWWGDQEAAGAKDWVKETVDLYHQKHPNVTIKTVLQTTDGLVPAFKAAAAAKKGPDIQYFWGGIWSLEDAWAGATKPVSDYIPKEELDHYLNGSEDTFDGKVWTAPWYVQPSFPVLYRTDVLDKAGLEAPQTWDELLAACDKLSSMGITPIAGGIKDGWFGGWLYSIIGGQGINSIKDLLAAVAGDQKFTDPEHADWWTRLQEMRDHKCWNDDMNSLELYQGQQRWTDGKAAMTVVAGSDAKKFIEDVGPDKVGVMAMPKWGDGPYAGKLGSTSQTLGITAWTKYPQVAADFIMFMHTPDRMKAWFETTGAFPADDRFDTSLIQLEQQSDLFDLVKDGAPYLENFIPTELDSKANFEQSQLLLSGNTDAQQAAQATEDIAERIRRTKRDLIENFKKWSESY